MEIIPRSLMMLQLTELRLVYYDDSPSKEILKVLPFLENLEEIPNTITKATTAGCPIETKRSSSDSLAENSNPYDMNTTSRGSFLELIEAFMEPVSSFTQESSPEPKAPLDEQENTSTPSWIEQQFIAEFARNSSSLDATESCYDIFAIGSTADPERLNAVLEDQQQSVDHIQRKLKENVNQIEEDRTKGHPENPTVIPGYSHDGERATEMLSSTKQDEKGEYTPNITLETITVPDLKPRTVSRVSQDDDAAMVMRKPRAESEIHIEMYPPTVQWDTEQGPNITFPVEENHGIAEEHSEAPATIPIDDTSLKHAQLRCRINAVLQHIDQHVCEGVPLIGRQKLNWDDCTLEEGILQPTVATLEATKGKRIKHQRLQLIVRMLATVHQLLTTGTSCTKRELYYLHLDLVRSPACCYAALADVCALLDVEPWEVNVFNTSKGLIAGPLVLIMGSGETIDCSTCRWGTPVPMDVSSVMLVQSTAKAVLVVEKDTVFKRLLEDGLMAKCANSLLLITAKGYPDVSTRLLLRKIVDTLGLPVYALVDADPHGIEILCVYKFGSLAMAHRQQSLAVPTIQWIGLFPSDIELLGLHSISLRDNELRKIELMIERPYAAGLIKKELLLLRQLAVKTEIESLFHIASDFIITVYLKQKLKECSIGS
ncbi:hypothetical protein AND_001014 [Anopheles darlingi]|uniref:DNA topoisomerase (ATP-hydrolyzing) n=1 Tax=Anopheles darlingi TaxID=43151 RepID=W5JS00_ANODA|nr:hypothetical protein AND_001014 [Anopheles darlingi]